MFTYVKGYDKAMNSATDIADLLAKNLTYFMSRPDAPYKNANALAVAAKIDPNTVRNMMNPTRRTRATSEDGKGYPTLKNIAAIADKLPKCKVWMLLHPNLERALWEQQVAEDFERLNKSAPIPTKIKARV